MFKSTETKIRRVETPPQMNISAGVHHHQQQQQQDSFLMQNHNTTTKPDSHGKLIISYFILQIELACIIIKV